MKNNEILFVTNVLGNGGAARVIAILANYFSNNGYSVSIITFPFEGNELYKKSEIINYIALVPKGQGIKKKISRISLLRDELKKHSNAIVVSFEYFVNMQTIIASAGLHNRVIVSERNDPAQVGGKFPTSYIRNILYRFCEKIVCQTPDAKAYFPKSVQKHTVIIPNPIKSDLPEPWLGERTHEIVSFCRLEKQKNLPLLIDAFEQVHTVHPDYTLHIYGDGREKEPLEQYILGKGLQDCAFVHPAVAEIHKRVLKCAMFVSSSDYEGLSNSMLEAMAIGLPCIVSDCPCGGARMMISSYENGILVPVRHERLMYEAIKFVIENPEKAAKISRNAVKVRRDLAIDTIFRYWEQLFN